VAAQLRQRLPGAPAWPGGMAEPHPPPCCTGRRNTLRGLVARRTADATVVRAHQHAALARHAPPKDIDPARLAVAVLSAPARARDCIE